LKNGGVLLSKNSYPTKTTVKKTVLKMNIIPSAIST
jgi:hypothetical protein